MDKLTVESEDGPEERVAQHHCVADDRIEDRLDIGLRLTDDAQALARRGLLLKSLTDLGMGPRQRRVLFLKFGEQPYMLDGDDGLVGEGLKKRNLCLGEKSHLGTPKIDCPDGDALSQQRDAQDGAEAVLPGEEPGLGELL